MGSIVKKSFGITKDGVEVFLFTLSNLGGMEIKVTNYGAILVSVLVPDQAGTVTDVVLGYDELKDYEVNPTFFGSTIGRNGNRIAAGRFLIDDQEYQLPVNEAGVNSLHSCPDGYNLRPWEIKEVSESENAVTFRLFSAHLDQGFPGNFNVTVTYQLTDDNEVRIHYHGTADQKTVINMTNHSYFNLSGHDKGDILNHLLWLDSDEYVPVDANSIPLGGTADVAGTPMDFRKLTRIGERIEADFEQLKLTGGYDHNFVLKTVGEQPELIAEVRDEQSGRTMKVYTDLPGVQFYAGNFVNMTCGKGGVVYDKRSGLCLETQYFPDAVNQSAFVSPLFEAGTTYKTTTIYKFC